MSTPSLRDVIDHLHSWYPPETADSWDAVGLVAGDPDQPVRKILFAVDPVLPVAEEAAAWGADLVVTHHPLFLKPVHSVAATTPKGRTLATLTRSNCALLAAHTNADQALTGVSESLALALGMSDLRPIIAAPAQALDQLVVFVPLTHAETVRAAVVAAGAGAIDDYDQCTFSTPGVGRFRPLAGSDPYLGTVGTAEVVQEERIESILPRGRRSAVIAALHASHPYEQPAFHLTELADPGATATGTGRVGVVEPTTLGQFARDVARILPGTAQGVRAAGDPDRVVRKVAVCGGAGDFLLDRMAGSDVDVYLTSDLRHHPASEFVEQDGPALLDVAHWAAEWTWLPQVAARVTQTWGGTVEVRVSEYRSDPWTFRVDSAQFEGDLH